MENGRLASSGRYRENSVDRDTNHMLRHIHMRERDRKKKKNYTLRDKCPITEHAANILPQTHAAKRQGALQKGYYKDFICIIDVAGANYRTAEIGGNIIIQHLIRDD